LKNTVYPLFDSSQDFWIQLLYHEEDKRFDIVVDDGFFFFQINFEPNYPVFDHNAKINRIEKFINFQDQSQIDKNLISNPLILLRICFQKE